MFIYWRRHPDLSPVDLPQTIMRPFWHPEAVQLDDNRFCIRLELDRPVIAAAIMLIVSVCIITVAGLQFYETYMAHTLNGIPKQRLYQELAVAGGLLVASMLGFYIFYRIHKARYICFKRDTHSIHFPRQGLIPSYVELDYDEFQGRIEHRKNLLGGRMSVLMLAHDDRKQSILLTSTRDNPQTLAGFWSFLVQYMKKDAPLPDVPALHEYPNKTPGVIHHSTINYT